MRSMDSTTSTLAFRVETFRALETLQPVRIRGTAQTHVRCSSRHRGNSKGFLAKRGELRPPSLLDLHSSLILYVSPAQRRLTSFFPHFCSVGAIACMGAASCRTDATVAGCTGGHW